jgi:hypothetical protein
MKKAYASSSWGVTIIEDTETGHVSLQCICGGIGMYYRRMIMSEAEIEQWRSGTLDIVRLVSDICKEVPRVAARMVPAIAEEELAPSS